MSIYKHIKNVDWNKVHKKSTEMDRAKNQVIGLLASIIPLFLILRTNIFYRLEQLGLQVQISSLEMMFKFFILVYCSGIIYSCYNYFKWSRYDVMRRTN